MSSDGKTDPTHPSNDNLPVDGASSSEHHATHEHHATDVKQITNQTDRVTEDNEPNKYGRSLEARVEGGGHDQRDTADVSGGAGVGSSGMGGLASLELGDPVSSHNRKYTEKGFEYKCDLQKRDFQQAVSRWRAAASKAERGLHEADTAHLKGFRDDLELEMACVSAELHNYTQFLSPDHQSVVRENVTWIQQQNRDLLERITEQIRERNPKHQQCLSNLAAPDSHNNLAVVDLDAVIKVNYHKIHLSQSRAPKLLPRQLAWKLNWISWKQRNATKQNSRELKF